MSKFTTTAATSHELSLTAMEEASRFGQRTADIDHLLLALVLNGQAAGLTLRAMGITLDSAREAVVDHHAAQIASLGISTPSPEPGRITFHETGGYSWSERALGVIKRSTEGRRKGDAVAVLRELLAEPSGLIQAVLLRLGTTPEAVLVRLDEVEETSTITKPTGLAGQLSGASEIFVSASPDQVWQLLIDPERMPDWEPNIGSVDVDAQLSQDSDGWVAYSQTRRPDGKRIRVSPQFVVQHIEPISRVEGRNISWRITYPDAPKSNAKVVAIGLEPVTGGAQLHLSLAWELNPNRVQRPVLSRLFRPISRPWLRFLIWLQLSQLGSGISRALR